MILYCCGCESDIEGRLCKGAEVYPHRKDLTHIPFWICDHCKNFVGCHYKTKNMLRPLGCIATKEIKQLRRQIHNLLDPLWRGGKISRKKLYKDIAINLKIKEYHTANINSVEQAYKVLNLLQSYKEKI